MRRLPDPSPVARAAISALLCCAVAAAQGPAATAAAPVPVSEADIDAALKRFERLGAKKQEKVLAEVRAAVSRIDDPLLRSIRARAREVQENPGPPPDKLSAKRPKTTKAPRGHGEDLPFPVQWEYVFGTQRVKPPGKTKRAEARDARVAELRAMLLGFPPDLDAARASLLRQLDVDRGADTYARLLTTWRNGKESFYDALDRTAGTREALFFYDAMLNDFRNQCIPDGHPDGARVRRSLQASHDALHKSFLAYRQYRGFREAMVLSLLLPPDTPLPESLSRYEQKPANGYSAREVFVMLLAHEGNDIGKVAELIVRSSPPLPSGLWDGYEPFGSLYGVYQQLMPEMIEQHGGTDQLRESQDGSRLALKREIARAAFSALP